MIGDAKPLSAAGMAGCFAWLGEGDTFHFEHGFGNPPQLLIRALVRLAKCLAIGGTIKLVLETLS